jgi:hypothetical protein
MMPIETLRYGYSPVRRGKFQAIVGGEGMAQWVAEVKAQRERIAACRRRTR